MNSSKIIDGYFKELDKNLNYEKTSRIMGYEYNLLDKSNKNKILRFFIDENLEVCISKANYTNDKTCFCDIASTDLLIIGMCLRGRTEINYKGKNVINKSEVLYFRPDKNFSMEFSNHDFLYYIVDLNNLKKSLHYPKCKKNKNLFCNSYVDCICRRGEIYIKEAPYMMKSCIGEIKEIENVKTDSILDYTNMKGQLFNYLTCLLKVRADGDPSLNRKTCRRHRCKKNRVSEAKKIIIDNLDKHITIDEIAQRLDISAYKLQKGFKKIEGRTVYSFILKVRMDNSKTLLEKTDYPIIEIAQKIGYENPSKFSTAFKRETGYTPTEYRQLKRD